MTKVSMVGLLGVPRLACMERGSIRRLFGTARTDVTESNRRYANESHKRRSLWFQIARSLSPVHTIAITQRPSSGTATVDVNHVRYRSRPGFVGNDTFTYAMHGRHSALGGSPSVWRVRVHVTVVPKSR